MCYSLEVSNHRAKQMSFYQTALSLLADEIKNAGFEVVMTKDSVKVSLAQFPVFSLDIQKVLNDAGMEGLYTADYDYCGSTFVKPLIN